jgi:outer membrane protein assembly factor BamB
VIFGSFDGSVYALDIETGAQRWRYDGGPTAFLASPAVADGVAYVADFTLSASILALDASTGVPIWELPVDQGVGASPIVGGDTVYIQVPGTFYALAR